VSAASCIAVLIFAGGCHRGAKPQSAANVPGPLPQLPAELDQAMLLCHDSKGILLFRPSSGEPARLVVPDGRYPRWLADGSRFVFIRGGDVAMHDLRDGSETVLASPGNPIAVAADVAGEDVLYIANRQVYRISGVLSGGKEYRAEKVLDGRDFREIAVSGDLIVTTTGLPLRGYGVYLHEPPYGDGRLLGNGCSAGISPDGALATINLSGHTELALVDTANGERRGVVRAPS
jgi:hypothetical protein